MTSGSDTPPRLVEAPSLELLPSYLLVVDPDNCTGDGSDETGPNKPYRTQHLYSRVLPPLQLDGPQSSLSLSAKNKHGKGHHSTTYHATFTLPESPVHDFASDGGKTTVIAKLGFTSWEDREHMSNEAKILSQLTRKAPGQDWDRALAPEFYGFYKPVQEHCRRWLIVMEDCGSQVEPCALNHTARLEIFSLFKRLHALGIVHYSPHARNIVSQPGPLYRQKSERSTTTPSFRLVDFGRSERLSDMIEAADGIAEETRIKLGKRVFETGRKEEMRRLGKHLGLSPEETAEIEDFLP